MNTGILYGRIESTADTLGFPPCLEHKTLLLKTPHTLVAEHREIKLELTWELPPCWLAFTVLWGATVNPECSNTNLPSKTCPLDNSDVKVMGVTNQFLNWFEACFTRDNPNQNSLASGVINPTGLTATIICYCCSIHMVSNCLLNIYGYAWNHMLLGRWSFCSW